MTNKLLLSIFVLLFNINLHAATKFESFVPSVASDTHLVPVVLLLHGCNQTSKDIMELTKIKELAEKEGFAVFAPEQDVRRNNRRCWNWFYGPYQARYGLEVLEVMRAFSEFVSTNPINVNQVFIAGLSAGGGMAGLISYFYPDLFQAVAVHSGVSFKRAHSALDAVKVMKKGPEKLEKPKYCNYWAAPLLVIQGGSDKVVHPNNAEALIYDLGACDTSKNEIFLDPKLTHAWSGGAKDKKYSYPEGQDATLIVWEFFKKHLN